MMLFRHFVGAFLLCLCLASCAPTTNSRHPGVFGTVKDAATGEPIAGATVIYESLNGVSATTDSQGQFQMKGEDRTEISFVGGEAPPISASLRATKPDYFPNVLFESRPFGGGPKVKWEMNMELLSESHPVAPYAAALKKSVENGGGYDEWRAIVESMQTAGLRREDGVLMIEHIPDIFENLPKTKQAQTDYDNLIRKITGGFMIWPLGTPVSPHIYQK